MALWYRGEEIYIVKVIYLPSIKIDDGHEQYPVVAQYKIIGKDSTWSEYVHPNKIISD